MLSYNFYIYHHSNIYIAGNPLDRIVTSIHLDDVAHSNALSDWQRVCKILGVPDAVITSASLAYMVGVVNGPSRAFDQALSAWRQEKVDGATYRVLLAALRDSGFGHTAQGLRQSIYLH